MQSRVNKHFAEWYADVLRLEQNEHDLEAVAFLRDEFNDEVMNDLAPNATARARRGGTASGDVYGRGRHGLRTPHVRARLL